MKKSHLRKIIREEIQRLTESKVSSFKKGWIGTYVKRKGTGKKIEVVDAKNYGSYQELFLKDGTVLQMGASRTSAGIIDPANDDEYVTV